MASWLRGTNWFQRIALALLLLACAAFVYPPVTGGNPSAAPIILALLVLFFAFRRRLLWRVRNRLLMTFFLFGVVPIFLIFWLLQLTAILVLGQFASERVRHELEARIASVHDVTRNLVSAASHNAAPQLLEDIRRREPRLSVVLHVNNQSVKLKDQDGTLAAAPEWIAPGFQGLFESGGNYYLGANLRDAQAHVDAFAYLPLDDKTLATLTPGVVAVAGIISAKGNTNVAFTPSGSQVSINQKGGRKRILSPQVPPAKGSWDVDVATLLSYPVRIAPGEDTTILFPVLSRPSRLLEGVVAGRMGSVIVSVLIILAGFFLVVELVSLISSFSITRTITRSVHDLYQGTLHIAAGDFSHQIPVRGKHQLSELAASFNGMTSRIQHYIGEMRKKEKLESELAIARQVQARLFPRSIPELKTLELAGVCLPGRFVSGDYYDFVPLDERYTAIALGDVSGKGVSAALLMASIQSSLHGHLRFSGQALSPSLSTATLMALISQQLYESTPAEKYATFFCSVYDDESAVLRYSNCGHLKPILVRGGQVSTLEGDGMVVGLLPNVRYEQREFQMQAGDLIAIFSDGIPEAENAQEQEFGEQRLAELLRQHAARPLEGIIQAVTDGVAAWAYDPDARDDTTLVLLRTR